MKKKIVLGLAAFGVLIQLLPAPAKTNPPTDPARTFAATMKPPAAVQNIFNRACRDCHSNETQWPWYANVAPVSWPVRNHVNEGRKHLNFSEWLNDWSTLEDICKSVRENTMPLPYYDWMHPEAKLTPAERASVCEWVDSKLK